MKADDGAYAALSLSRQLSGRNELVRHLGQLVSVGVQSAAINGQSMVLRRWDGLQKGGGVRWHCC